jgi:hypothetical protein
MGMNLRPFGRRGLMISPLTLGTMEFGSKSTRPRRLGCSRAPSTLVSMPSTRPTCTPQAGARRSWGA